MPKAKKQAPNVSSESAVKPTIVSTVLSEKDMLEKRQHELTVLYETLLREKLNDIGQVEVRLSQVNKRLTEL